MEPAPAGWQGRKTGLRGASPAQPRGQDFKKNKVKPHLKRTWCAAKMDAIFSAKMEKLLWLYSLPCDERFPVVCFNERRCFLIGEEIDSLSLQSGKVAKQHYAYVKNGSCALLAAIELLTGTGSNPVGTDSAGIRQCFERTGTKKKRQLCRLPVDFIRCGKAIHQLSIPDCCVPP